MNKIKIIPDVLVNKIAAGEVVERPASVVKELIENSLDAGATEINIDLSDGGKRYIRVVDNGEGMFREDAILSFERHATSKISEEKDLYSVTTLGFRGEALPSIASVSEVDVTTKTEDSISGAKLKVRNGKVQEIMDSGCPQGTAIEIKNLFYNIPARYKFLKSANTELSHIVNTITRYALSHPEVRFTLLHNGKNVLDLLKGRGMRIRISEVMDKKIARELLDFKDERNGVSIRGFLSPPEYSLSNRKGQFTYVNGRWIRDRLITHAIGEGCRPFFMRDRFPMVILFINLSPLDVDVNVHPTKIEVRFKNTSIIYELILNTFKNTLSSLPLLKRPDAQMLRPEDQPIATKVREPVPYYDAAGFEKDSESFLFDRVEEKDLTKVRFTDLKIIGQLWDSYVLCQGGETFVLIDQHAVHERVTFERLRKEYFSSGVLKGHPLLVPQVIELSPREKTFLIDSIETFKRFGIEIEPFGGNDFVIKSLPEVLMDRDCRPIVRDLLYEVFSTGKGTAISKSIDAVLINMACHSAIRGKRSLDKREIEALLKDLEGVDISSNCPHGRPMIKRFFRLEVERLFKRR